MSKYKKERKEKKHEHIRKQEILLYLFIVNKVLYTIKFEIDIFRKLFKLKCKCYKLLMYASTLCIRVPALVSKLFTS